MNKDMILGATSSTSSDFQLFPSSREMFHSSIHFSDIRPITTIMPQQQNPNKKRTKIIRLQNMSVSVGTSQSSKPPKYGRKPEPNAPKITPPCTECGKKFWSWKALFGHMRCHPERPWRGINPPSNPYNATPMLMVASHGGSTTPVTINEDRYVASCLLMLANGRMGGYEELGHQGLFECNSCKKVFGSDQALGGHRMSHKNVKGCFAITKNEGGEEGEVEGHLEKSNIMMIVGSSSSSSEQHKCNICLRVFSSGQALGGYKRCHWEKEEDNDDAVVQAASISVVSQGPYRLDLNLPAPGEDYSNLGLDLRLGL